MIIIERATRINIFSYLGMSKTSIKRKSLYVGTRAGWVGDSQKIHKYIGTCLKVMEGLKTGPKAFMNNIFVFNFNLKYQKEVYFSLGTQYQYVMNLS